MLVVGSGGVDLVDDHSSDLDHARGFQGVDPRRFTQLPTMANTFPDWMSTTSYSAERDVAQPGFYSTLDMAHTPNTWTNTLSYSTEHGFANQRADRNIDQGAGYTTPGTSSCPLRAQGARSFIFFASVAARWREYSENFADIAAQTWSTPSHAAKAIFLRVQISMSTLS
ncbi:hypothetical protein IFM46972_03398 [Aspergillus udagawae]|uniref:Uncharacterized protein n=1 Tax=Aspergillus udagawae TaxID=91492 RepID=A0A8H3NDR5_9EURO|nr:hypothetical protein IFM46972_03398 [Aspergillus udagawae]